MKKQYSISEQFVIKFYQFYKLQVKVQQKILEDKQLAKKLTDEIS